MGKSPAAGRAASALLRSCNGRLPCIIVVLFVLLLLLMLIIDQAAVHRIQSLSDLRLLIHTLSLSPALSSSPSSSSSASSFTSSHVSPSTPQQYTKTRSPRCLQFNTSHLRCLPNAFLVGASKAGTTSLAALLKQIPRIYFESRFLTGGDKHSEVHRFDRPAFGRAWKSLDLLVEWASAPIVSSENDVVIHYTPHYLFAPSVPFELKKLYPAAESLKFIVLLRDPVDRAWSSFWFKRSHLFHNNDTGSVSEFISKVSDEQADRKKYESCFMHALGTNPSTSNYHSKESPEPYRRFLSVLTSNLLQCSCESKTHFSNFSSAMFWTSGCETRSNAATTQMFFRVLQTCFGSDFRKAKLGLRNIDKSVYVDQILRWQLNFSKHQFLFISTAALANDPHTVILKIIKFLTEGTLRSNVAADMVGGLSSLNVGQRHLYQPNKKSLHASLSSVDRVLLEKYFSNYNSLLSSFLCDDSL